MSGFGIFGRYRKAKELLKAAETGNKDEVLKLLTKGANVNATDNFGRTPLLHASRNGHTNVVEALLDEGANVDARDNYGNTPLHLAITCKGRTDVAEALIAQGANVNTKNYYGWTPLYSATHRGYTNVAEVLIAKGADANTKNNDGNTPLHDASYGGYTNVAAALIAKGAIVNAKDNYGNTPLHLAIIKGHTDVAEALLAKWADANTKNNDGNTPLHDASYRGYTNVAAALIAKGANVNAMDYYGRTSLHEASSKGHIDLANVLIAKGADIDAVNDYGETPFDVAKSKGNDSIANLLEAAHSKQNALLLLRKTNQNQEMTLTGFDQIKHETVGSGEEAGQKHDKLPDEDGKGDKACISNTPTDQVQFELTDKDLHFLKMGRELVRDGGDSMPVFSIKERSAIQTLATQMVDIERSLESVRELPPSLSGREPEVAEYFFSFTNAFARAFTAAQALSSGAVKCEVDLSLQSLLGGASWVAEHTKLPFVGCISIFSAMILHQRETKKTNTFMAFEEFFRGNSRDHYLLTCRKLAELICLQLDISLLNGDNPVKAGKLKEQVKKKIVAPIQKHLRKIHLDTILELSPVEAKAMADLSSLTKEVLRLHQDEHRTYDELRTSNERVKASYFVEQIFGKVLIPSSPEQKPLIDGATQSISLEPSANGSQSHINEVEARLQHLLKKMRSLEEHSHAKGQEIQKLRAQLRKLADKVESQKDLTVPSGNQAQVQMNPNKTKGDLHQIGQDFNAAQLQQDIRQLQMQLEKQSQALERAAFENFINIRVLSFHEAFEFTRKIISMAHTKEGNKIEVSEDGRFVLHGKNHCIGTVCEGRLLSKKRTLWKGKLGIKLEDEHRGVESIMDWFEETKLRPLYERNKKQAIRIMFADELDVEPALPVAAQPQAQHDRDELFDTDIGPNVR